LPSRFTWLNFRTTLGRSTNNYRLDRNRPAAPRFPRAHHGERRAPRHRRRRASFTIQKDLEACFVEEGAALRDRLSSRRGSLHQNRRVRTNFQRVYYPEVQLVVGDLRRGFLPAQTYHENRISNTADPCRTGASGVQPGPNDALRTFTAKLGEHQEHGCADRASKHRQRQLCSLSFGRGETGLTPSCSTTGALIRDVTTRRSTPERAHRRHHRTSSARAQRVRPEPRRG